MSSRCYFHCRVLRTSPIFLSGMALMGIFPSRSWTVDVPVEMPASIVRSFNRIRQVAPAAQERVTSHRDASPSFLIIVQFAKHLEAYSKRLIRWQCRLDTTADIRTDSAVGNWGQSLRSPIDLVMFLKFSVGRTPAGEAVSGAAARQGGADGNWARDCCRVGLDGGRVDSWRKHLLPLRLRRAETFVRPP